MSDPLLIPVGGGEIVGDAPHRRVEILSDAEELNATWSRFGPHRDGADLHVHRRHSDLFYVLEGDLTVRLGSGDEPVVVPAGTLARVPPLVVHGFRNGSDADVRYLNFHAPGRKFADYLRALRDGRPFSYDQHPPPADGGRTPTEAVVGGNSLVVGRPGLRVKLLADVEEIGISETSVESGARPTPEHVHRRHVESFYVLEGELVLTVGGRDLPAPKGSWVQVPPGVAHSFGAPANKTVRFLDVHTPCSGFGDFLRLLRGERADDEWTAREAGFDQRWAAPRG